MFWMGVQRVSKAIPARFCVSNCLAANITTIMGHAAKTLTVSTYVVFSVCST